MEMYVLQIKPECELIVARDLNKAGYPAYVPQRIALHRRGGTVWRTQHTVFSGYVFVETDLAPVDYRRIVDTPGVSRFLGFGSPEPIRPEEVQYIKWLHNSGDIIEPSEVHINTAGEMQPIAGMICKLWPDVVKHNPRQNRATVRIPIAGKDYSITLAVLYSKSPTCSVCG